MSRSHKGVPIFRHKMVKRIRAVVAPDPYQRKAVFGEAAAGNGFRRLGDGAFFRLALCP